MTTNKLTRTAASMSEPADMPNTMSVQRHTRKQNKKTCYKKYFHVFILKYSTTYIVS